MTTSVARPAARRPRAAEGQDEDAAFGAAVQANLAELGDRIVKLAGTRLIPDRAVAARRLVANAPVRAATETAARGNPPSDELTLPPGVTWLRAPTDTMAHARAAAVAPRVPGWVTLVAHTDRGAVVDGNARLEDQAVASRLGFPLAGDSAKGTRSPLAVGPAGTILLVCDWAAEDFHRLTQKRVLAPVGKTTIMLPTGNVIAGSWSLVDGERVPVPDGHWLLWEDGASRELDTADLAAAAGQLGLKLLPGGRPPGHAVGFYYTLTDWQTAALSGLGYSVADQRSIGPGTAGGFYESLTTVAWARLETVFGRQPDPALVRQRIVEEFERDSRSPHPRYADLIAGSTTPAEILAVLRDLSRWNRQAADLVPHVAADVFGLDLRVLGVLGLPPAVGAVGGPRTADPDGHPYLLVRLADGQFLPVRRVPGADSPAWPLPETRASELSAWARELSPDQRRLVAQGAVGAPLPAGVGEPAAIGRMAEMEYLAKTRFTARSELRLAVRHVLLGYVRWIGAGQPIGPEADKALAEIAAAERFGQLIDSNRVTLRSTELTREYTQAAVQAGRQPQNLADIPGAAAWVKALAEQIRPRIGDDEPPAGEPRG